MSESRAEDSDYARFARPLVARLLHACRLDKVYHRAEGDLLWTTDSDGHEIEVLDMVGGFGVGLLGHNCPVLVEVVRQALEARVPFHAQGSHRAAAGRLCRRLSELAGAWSGRRYVVTLASTGAEAVEAAIKHAEFERADRVRHLIDGCREHHRQIQEKLRNRACRVVPRLLAGIGQRFGLEADGEPDFEEVFHSLLAHNAKILDSEPVFLTLEGAFHGKTSGAVQLTHDPAVRHPFRSIGIRSRFLPRDDIGSLEAAVAEATLTCLDLAIDAEGVVRIVERRLVNVAALFIEPIQGEGGVIEIGAEYLVAARKIANEGGFPLVLDEIQSGVGRTGKFLASETHSIAGDYITLSKALGGGLVKISALLVDATRYRESFGLVHTSTFSDDDPSSLVALAAVERIVDPSSDVLNLVTRAGHRILDGLREIQHRYPEVISDVRGRGLLIGLEFARADDSDSPMIRVLSSQGYLGFSIAGYLLNNARIRVLPTLSRSQTIRIEPSAFIGDGQIDSFLEAIERVCRVLDLDRSDQLIGYLCRDPAHRPGDPLRPNAARAIASKTTEPTTTGVVRRRPVRPARANAIPPLSGRVSFIGHFIRPGHLRHWDPALADLDDEELTRFLDRTHRLLDPFVSETAIVTSLTGEKAHLSSIGIPITPSHMHRAFREGDIRWIEAKILDAVRLARRQGSSIVGLGGYTSILTGQGTRISEDRLGITSGNAMTVAMGVDALVQTAEEAGIDLAKATLGALGATGNICSLYTQMMAESVERIVLVGRPGMESRLATVADDIYAEMLTVLRRQPEGPHRGVPAILSTTRTHRETSIHPDSGVHSDIPLHERIDREMGPEAPVAIECDPTALRSCNLIVAASSTPDPVLYPEHLGDGPIVICDVAIPEDTAPAVLRDRPDVRVIRGGLVQLPVDRELVLAGVPLEPGLVFACTAETLLLGLSRTSEHFSWGRVTRRHVERIRELARYHGFTLSRPAMEALL